ncbi:MAG: MFS transporter [Rhizobiaceae bacterium]|nr:MFS transporter [Rhizobiaceae bacterium]MCV0407933.1 MFS transporter [Rhizobiaceae bacterium]
MNRLLPIVLAVALFMEQMDSTVIATSLPAIAKDIGTGPIALKLALTAYLVSLAIFIPVSSWMADRFGARRVFRAAIAVFMVGSLACAVSGSLGEFVAARFLQGMGGSMMTPVARLILVRGTPRSDLVRAMAWLTIPALVGPLVGPPLGGFITTYFSWHWIFLINLPIGAIGIFFAGRVLPDMPGHRDRAIDWTGFALSGLAASGIVFGLSVISLPALPPVVGAVTATVGIVCAVLYVRHARRAATPLLDLALLKNDAFRAAIVGGNLFRIGVGAIPFLLPLFFQLGFGLNPFQSGLLTFASAGGALLMKFFAAPILKAAGFRIVLSSAAVLGACLIAANALFTPHTPWLVISGVLLAAGFMRSLFFTSANALTFADIDDTEASQATAISSVSQQVTIALGVAVAGGILEVVAFWSGHLTITAFEIAFVAVAMISALAALPFLRLPLDAGQTVSGHRPKVQSVEAQSPPV